MARSSRSRGADYAAALDGLGAPGAAATAAPRLRGGVAAAIADRVEQIPLDVRGLNVTLRGYQHFGVQYLVGQRRSILGDEMGLGKTIQALAAMCHLRATEQATHFFVVAPASILSNWIREIAERTDLPAHLLHGDGRDEAARPVGQRGRCGRHLLHHPVGPAPGRHPSRFDPLRSWWSTRRTT